MTDPLAVTFQSCADHSGFDVTYQNVSELPIDLWMISTIHGVTIRDRNRNRNRNRINSGNEFGPRHHGPFRISPNEQVTFTHHLAGWFEETSGTHSVTARVDMSVAGGPTRVVKHSGNVQLELPTLMDPEQKRQMLQDRRS